LPVPKTSSPFFHSKVTLPSLSEPLPYRVTELLTVTVLSAPAFAVGLLFVGTSIFSMSLTHLTLLFAPL
jgi:hypothetical protein